MARQATVSVSNTASKGLITEATGLNFPEDAWTDANNVIPDNKGKTSRRLGFDYEEGAGLIDITRDSSVMSTGTWSSVGGNGDINFVVVQVGDLLYFFEESDTDALSLGYKPFTVDLDTFKVSGAPSVTMESCGFAFGKGYLFVTHPFCEPFYVAYDETTDTIEATAITIQLRDFEGVEDDLEPNERINTLSDAHEYNLCNQGWAENQKNSAGTTISPIVHYAAVVTGNVYPSNAQQWWTLKNASEEFTPASFSDSFSIGNSLAPRGHFILDWFNTDRSGADAQIGTVTERSASYFRPNSCAFFAGRVFYSGLNYQNYVGEVYFTQIIENVGQLGKCYQEQDPTSEILSDLLATDGGVIRILDCGAISKIFATAKGLLVFATNGIWSISGTDTTPFKATEYSVVKVSGIRTLGTTSFVESQGLPVWWSQEGIFLVSSNEIGSFKVDSLTDTTIKTFYNDIPQLSKDNARGVYNPITKIITWVYSSNGDATGNAVYNFDKVLHLNTLTGAFYTYTIDTTQGVVINGVIVTKSNSFESTSVLENVVDASAANVVDASAAQVTVVTHSGGDFTNFATKYLVSKASGSSTTAFKMSFAEEYSSLNRDWQSLGSGVAYSSYFIAGYKIKGDAQRFGQNNYVIVYCNEVTNGSAFFNVIWDYGKVVGTANQLYRSAGGSIMQQTRIMLRGRGRVAQFKVISDGDDPFEVIGWSVFETENSTV